MDNFLTSRATSSISRRTLAPWSHYISFARLEVLTRNTCTAYCQNSSGTEFSFRRFEDPIFPNRITKDDKCWSGDCDTWSTMLGEAHGSRVLLMYLYLREERRKTRTEELHNLHSLSNTIRAIKVRSISWVGHVTRMRKISRGYGEFEGKRLFGKPRDRWDFNPYLINVENMVSS